MTALIIRVGLRARLQNALAGGAVRGCPPGRPLVSPSSLRNAWSGPSGLQNVCQCSRGFWTRSSRSSATKPAFTSTALGASVHRIFHGARNIGPRTSAILKRSYTRSGPSRLQLPQGDAVIYGIIGVNVAIFGVWTLAGSSYQHTRFMMDHFTCSPRGVLQDHRLHTLFTNMFSHHSFGHLLMNCVTLYFFGAEAVALLGARRFLNLYLAGGLASSLSCVAWPYVAPSLGIPASYRVSTNTAALGASGAINAIVSWSILMFPTRMIYVYMVLPVPAALVGLLFVVKDVSGLYKGGTGEANAGHLGGALVGATYFLMRRGRF